MAPVTWPRLCLQCSDPRGPCLLVRTLPALGSPSALGCPALGEQPAPLCPGRRSEQCLAEGDLQGRRTHKLWENSAMEGFCKAAVLLGRSLVDLQLTLVWGGQQECLKERKPSDLTCRSCPTLANLSLGSQRHANISAWALCASSPVGLMFWATLICKPRSSLRY